MRILHWVACILIGFYHHCGTGQHAERHGAEAITESGLSHWMWLQHVWDLKAHLQVAHFLQQGHTYSTKTTPPQSVTPFGAIFFQTTGCDPPQSCLYLLWYHLLQYFTIIVPSWRQYPDFLFRNLGQRKLTLRPDWVTYSGLISENWV